jgi:hypothetical protein
MSDQHLKLRLSVSGSDALSPSNLTVVIFWLSRRSRGPPPAFMQSYPAAAVL